MLAMQRRSGGMTSIPDEFVITSLDVVIHWGKKIGQGGFGRVFEAQWQGSRVAVKVLDRKVPRIVSG
jgi:serine/threonine protein kinase